MFPASLLSRLVSLVRGERRKRYLGLRGRGQEWEDLAEKRLKSEGYRILDRNFRTKVGELDFVARDGQTLCFVEVKGRRSLRFGTPAEAVTLEKQRRIYRAAEAYLQCKHLSESTCRFDVVSITDSDDGGRVEILRDAFRGPLPARPRR